MPWLPKLLMMLRPTPRPPCRPSSRRPSRSSRPTWTPSSDWQPPWYRQVAVAEARTAVDTIESTTSKSLLAPSQQTVASLLAAYPVTTDALAVALGVPVVWEKRTSTATAEPGCLRSEEHDSVRALLHRFPSTLNAMPDILGGASTPRRRETLDNGLAKRTAGPIRIHHGPRPALRFPWCGVERQTMQTEESNRTFPCQGREY